MRAVLDWSYELLTASEQTLLARLSTFSGGFTLAAAVSVASDERFSADEVVELVLGLTDKSLLCADVQQAEPRFCLLNTIRAYALDKLAESGESETIRKRHARHDPDACAESTRNPSQSNDIVVGRIPKFDPPPAPDRRLGTSESKVGIAQSQ
jgi:predicted ATPase